MSPRIDLFLHFHRVTENYRPRLFDYIHSFCNNFYNKIAHFLDKAPEITYFLVKYPLFYIPHLTISEFGIRISPLKAGLWGRNGFDGDKEA
jgi:hypothetical protein